MKSSRLAVVLLLLVTVSVGLRAQATLPTLKAVFPARTVVAGGPPLSINLRDHFEVPTVAGTVVQFDTVLGKFNVELLANDAPKTVANFLSYVADASYSNTIFHRSAALGGGMANRIIQGGGYVPGGASTTRKSPVALEYKLANARGTIAMARTSVADSATSEWFFNVDDNSTVLGQSNSGGYAVFGRVLGTGMTVVDAIAALPTYNAGGTFSTIPLRDMQQGQTNILLANYIVVNSIPVASLYPSLANSVSVLSFTATSANTGVVTTELAASTLTLRPIAAGSTTVTVRAVDTNGNAAESSFAVTVAAAPLVTTQPVSQTIQAGGNGTMSVSASGSPTVQWQRNGQNLSGITTPSVNLTDVQPPIVGLYTAIVTAGGAASTSTPAIIGVSTTSKVIGGGEDPLTPGWRDIQHPNGNYYDQVKLTGGSAAVTADHALNQVTRMSFIGLNDDIVQVEFSGPGTLSILMDSASGPAAPTKYNQPNVPYVRGHASIVITGANEYSNVSVFTVGKLTAYDPTGGFDISKPISETNKPANNGNPIFKQGVSYDGMAIIARISILSTNGKFGSIRTANTMFYDDAGYVGIYAPGITFLDRVLIGDINATGSATPVIILGSGPAEMTLITGGDLYQSNGQPIKVSGITKLKFQNGTDSHGNLVAAKKNEATLFQNDQNVTTQIVVNP